MSSSLSGNPVKLGGASLVIAPALMSIGDLMHPHESWDGPAQVAMIVAAPTRWYVAHLLLLVGALLLVPGLLLLTRVLERRRQRLAYASRVLLLVSGCALSAVFAPEMILGAFAARADQRSTLLLLEVFNSHILPALLPGLLAFFVGTGMLVVPIASDGGALRLPALCFGLGALFILGEIISAQVLLSQIGNVLIFVGGVGFARVLRNEAFPSPA